MSALPLTAGFAMRIPILIPEAGSYGVAIFLVYSLSAPSLTSHLRVSLRYLERFSFMTLYAALLLFICLWGFALFPANELFGSSGFTTLVSCPVGLALGVLAVHLDLAIVRSYRRKLTFDRPMRPSDRRWSGGPQQLSEAIRGAQPEKSLLPIDRMAAVVSLIMVAILEELVYRGFLVRMCLLLDHPVWTAVALGASVSFFALTHIRLGWIQVLAKTSLGVFALGAALLTGTVLSAIFIHVVFNVSAWQAAEFRS